MWADLAAVAPSETGRRKKCAPQQISLRLHATEWLWIHYVVDDNCQSLTAASEGLRVSGHDGSFGSWVGRDIADLIPKHP